MKNLSKILSNKRWSKQLLLSIFGLGLGLITSLLAIIIITDIQNVTQTEADLMGDNTLVIQKHVSTMTSLGANNTSFTENDIKDLKSKPFILEVAPFKTAHYEVGISENPGDGLPGFYAEMFLQSVPNSFLDNLNNEEWIWQNEDDIVPIILPRDFLTLVNYGIAPSKGLPQISEELIKTVRLRLHLSGSGKKGIVLGQVVGFSSKISSVLVPESFIDFSNQKYGNRTAAQPNRLLIKTKASSFGELNDLMSSMNLDISESDLSVAKISTFLIQMIGVFLVFAMVILALSIMSFVQYLQMLLYRINTEVSLLIKLGYTPKLLIGTFQQKFLKIILIITIISILVAFIVKWLVINPVLISLGLYLSYFGLLFGILFVILLIVGCIFLLRQVLLKTILKIFKKG